MSTVIDNPEKAGEIAGEYAGHSMYSFATLEIPRDEDWRDSYQLQRLNAPAKHCGPADRQLRGTHRSSQFLLLRPSAFPPHQ
jgi:hypothetical protein